MENEKKSVIYALVACVVWGTVYVAVRVGLSHGLMPLGFAGVRFFLGGLILLAVATARGTLRVAPRDLPVLFGLGLLQTGLQNALFFYGVQQTSAGVSAVFINTSPFFVILLAPFFFDASKITASRLLGLATGFCGVALASFHHTDMPGDFTLGVAALTGSALTWALANIAAKKIMPGRDTITVTGMQMVAGAVPLVVAGVFFEGGPLAHADATGLAALAYLVIFATSIPFFAWYRALEMGEVGRVSIFGFTLPVFGVVTGNLALGEPMTPFIVTGMALVALGIIIVNYNRRPEKT